MPQHYWHALAVEMDWHGFLQASYANPEVEALIIRGISDCLDDKGLLKNNFLCWQAGLSQLLAS